VAGAVAAASEQLRAPLADHFERVGSGWSAVTDPWRHSAAGQALCAAVDARVAAGAVVYPPEPLRALGLTGLADVRVVILGQDPYHGAGEAEGLAFSVQCGVKIPPSLRNIHAELSGDLGLPKPSHGSLLAWARAGVLLLNSTLTVERDRPASHARLGWAGLTDGVVAALARRATPCAFLLWGAHAQAKAALIEALGGARHGVFMSNHPSPLAARRPPVPFIGSRPYSRVNTWLNERGLATIDWKLTS
jgi:uracil-DNA glycosylase